MNKLKEKISQFYNVHPIIFLAIIAVLLGFLTSLFANQVSSIVYNLVPSNKYVNDQGMFTYMGKLLVQGKTPYIDFFDHKGPYIFYYTGLGELLGGRIGMMIVQTITFAFFYFFLLKSLILYKVNVQTTSIVVMLIMALTIFSSQSPSDFEIDYPFIMASIYFYLRAIQEENDKYFLYGNILTGITAGISIHLRATDAMVSLAMVIYFGVRQIMNKRYANLGINALVCIGGIILASLPPFIHSVMGGFTSLMYEACIINNFKYVSNSSGEDRLFPIICRIIIVLTSALIAASIIISKRKNKIGKDETLFYGISFAVIMVIQFIIAYYPHYLLIIFPLLLVLIGRVLSFIPTSKGVNYCLQGVMCAACLAGMIYFPVYNHNDQFKNDEAINEFINITINEEDKNGKTLCYQTSSAYYLNNNITVGYGDFAVQSNHMPIAKDYSFEKIKEYITSDKCKYVIIDKSYKDDYFTTWLKDESGLHIVTSEAKGNQYISIYTK